VPCVCVVAVAHLNAMDVAGELQMNMHNTVLKTRLARDGTPIGNAVAQNSLHGWAESTTTLPVDYCGSCYNATHPMGLKCCNDCESVKEAFMYSDKSLEEAENMEQCTREASKEENESRDGEGCRIHGTMQINRVAGNFHVALGRTFHRHGKLVHQFMPGEQSTYNASHTIHEYVSVKIGRKHGDRDQDFFIHHSLHHINRFSIGRKYHFDRDQDENLHFWMT
jgi:hypothetical protein